MPKGTKKGKSGRGRQIVASSSCVQSDFTVNDFANAASVKSGRMKKGEVNNWSVEAKAMNSQPSQGKDSLSWYEKDLSDFELTDQDENSDEEEQALAEASARPKTPKKKLKTNALDTGLVYPQDLWFMIGHNIHPGDVRSFGAICRGSHLVVHTAQFWSSLYRRYYSPARPRPLPAILQPPAMDKIHALQPHVVRSLFYTYPPFQERVKHLVPFESDPDILDGSRCVMMWHQHVKTQWHFYFKFHREGNSKNQCPLFHVASCYQELDPLLRPLNIHHNPEENCCVLKLVMSNFIYLPAVMGQCLIKSAVSVGHAMRYHKVKLMFDSQNVAYSKGTRHNGVTLVLDPVLDMHVLHWWDPKYPYSTTTTVQHSLIGS